MQHAQVSLHYIQAMVKNASACLHWSVLDPSNDISICWHTCITNPWTLHPKPQRLPRNDNPEQQILDLRLWAWANSKQQSNWISKPKQHKFCTTDRTLIYVCSDRTQICWKSVRNPLGIRRKSVGNPLGIGWDPSQSVGVRYKSSNWSS